jgi:hypothetical protein
MPDRRNRNWAIAAAFAAAALAPHVTAVAQSNDTATLAVARASAERVLPAPTLAETLPVAFAGTYRVTIALGADTAEFELRIGTHGREADVAMPAPGGRVRRGAVPIRALIVPVSLLEAASDDSGAARDSVREGDGTITAALADTSAPGRWWVTILAGDDTLSDMPAGRLSRLLRRAQHVRSALAERCRDNARDENRAAERRDDPAPCHLATGLPLWGAATAAGDGVLVLWPDGQARVEQRTETDGGELTLWGSRVPR